MGNFKRKYPDIDEQISELIKDNNVLHTENNELKMTVKRLQGVCNSYINRNDNIDYSELRHNNYVLKNKTSTLEQKVKNLTERLYRERKKQS